MKKLLLLGAASLSVLCVMAVPRQMGASFGKPIAAASQIAKQDVFDASQMRQLAPSQKLADVVRISLSEISSENAVFTPSFTALSSTLAENPLKETYYGYGVEYFEGVPEEWETKTAVDAENGSLLISDLLPLDASFAGWTVKATYDTAIKTIEIPSIQFVGTYQRKDGSLRYLWLRALDVNAEDVETISLAIGEDGSFVYANYLGLYATATETFSTAAGNGMGWYTLFNPGVEWAENYIARAPLTAAGTNELVLNILMTSNFYSLKKQQGLISPDAELTFYSLTPYGTYDQQEWSMAKMEYSEELDDFVAVDYETESGEIFSITTGIDSYYSYPVLTASNKGVSTTDTLFCGHNVIGDLMTAGGMSSSYLSADAQAITGTPLAMRATLDCGWGVATQVLRPGSTQAKTSGVTNVYLYQGAPASPLYFMGIKLPGYNFKYTDGEELLTLRIRACRRFYNYETNDYDLDLGDVLYTSQVPLASAFVMGNENAGYGCIEFTNFFENVEGLDLAVDYMQVDQEFCVEYTVNPESGFSFVPFAEYEPKALALPVSWYANANGQKAYDASGTNVWVAFDDAIYGYLYTEDEKDIDFPAEGGSVELVVKPMLYSSDSEGNARTALWLNENSDEVKLLWDDEDVSTSWLSAEIVNEQFSGGLSFTLRLTAEALPADMGSRAAHVVFEQWGAKLVLEVEQRFEANGLQTIVREQADAKNYFRLDGRRANESKGFMIGEDSKIVVK